MNLKIEQQKLTNVRSGEKTYGEKMNVVFLGPLRQYQTTQHTFNWHLRRRGEREWSRKQILKNKANVPQI